MEKLRTSMSGTGDKVSVETWLEKLERDFLPIIHRNECRFYQLFRRVHAVGIIA